MGLGTDWVAERHQGEASVTMKHTPVAAVDAGDIVLVGNTLCFSPVAIEADTEGSLDVMGGTLKAIVGEAIEPGYKVDFDVATGKVMLAGNGDAVIGISLSETAADGDEIVIAHQPEPLGS